MSDNFKNDSDNRKSRSKLEEEIYDDIKTYTLRGKLNKNDTFITNDERDREVKLYSPKHRTNTKTSTESRGLEYIEKTKSEDKKSKIRIKKQESSGSKTKELPDRVRERGNKKPKRQNDNVTYFNRTTQKYSEKPYRNERNIKYKEEYYEDDFMDDEYDVTPSFKFRLFKKLVTLILIVTVIGGGVSFIYVRNIISDMPVLTKKMVYESYINKNPVPLSKIPKTLRTAVISIEDERFYSHKGIDYKSILRSAVNNLSGNMMQGGSTIDMQVSKNLLTNSDRTLKRKIQDIYNARVLNKIMTKDEILEAYLNNIYLGKSAYGVQAGAQLYFGKDVQDLSFGQATMLAGITNNPSLYQDYEYAKKRQRIVLKKMYELGYIKENVYKAQLYRDTPFKSEVDK